MTTYRFWNGLKTIGGNIVEIRTAKARVLCDFGLTVGGQISAKQEGISETETLIQSGSLPAIEGLYDTTDFKTLSLTSSEDSNLETAVFVSHLHLDHMGGLRQLPEEKKFIFHEKHIFYIMNSFISEKICRFHAS